MYNYKQTHTHPGERNMNLLRICMVTIATKRKGFAWENNKNI